MKYYFINLQIQIGEYQKNTKHVVAADNQEEAVKQAMLNEAHDPENLDFSDDTFVLDMHGEFAYKMCDCREIPQADFEVLRQYL